MRRRSEEEDCVAIKEAVEEEEEEEERSFRTQNTSSGGRFSFFFLFFFFFWGGVRISLSLSLYINSLNVCESGRGTRAAAAVQQQASPGTSAKKSFRLCFFRHWERGDRVIFDSSLRLLDTRSKKKKKKRRRRRR